MAKRFAYGILTILTLTFSWQLRATEGCVETLSKGLIKLLNETIETPTKEAALSSDLKVSLSRFCSCKEKASKTNAKPNWIEQSFKDPREFFDQDDQCALDTLTEANYQLLFLAQLNSRMIPLLQDRLHERYRGIASHVATEASYNQHLTCVTDKVMVQCSRSLSLATTYLCVNSFLSSAGKIDNLEATCPSFHTEDVIEGDDEGIFSGPRI